MPTIKSCRACELLPPSQNICRFAFRETTLTEYILKNINIYGT